MPPPSSPSLAQTLQTALLPTSLPLPSLPWLQHNVLPTRNPPPPLASLLATARTRLLALDLTTPGLIDAAYAAAHQLPRAQINHAEVDGVARLQRDVVVQVLDVENLSRSRWEQVEELEALERGEGTRGREVVRVEATPAGDEDLPTAGDSKATHRLVLQDCVGQRVFAVELARVERVGVGRTSIGEKMMLKKGTKIARGVVLLEGGLCQVIGGKVEEWHKEWTKERVAKLKGAVEGGE
ncbi:hypothetical protein QBC39DRAFT_408615 [Podospora conica]|nr:hypothetical protein QBC39DRAFT_408615 [Schizothecium conicum]